MNNFNPTVGELGIWCPGRKRASDDREPTGTKALGCYHSDVLSQAGDYAFTSAQNASGGIPGGRGSF